MKRTIAIAAAAIMTTAIASAPAIAAGTDHNGGTMGTTNGMNSDNTGTMSNGSAGSNEMKSPGADTGASSGTMSSNDMVSSIQGLKQVSNVKVVNAADMANTDKTVQEGTVATDTTPEEQKKLQEAIMANPDLTEKLKNASVDPSDVVAANVDTDNTVTVYVR